MCCISGGCAIHNQVELVNTGLKGSTVSILLVTDRNDGGNGFTGVDFDIQSVQSCPVSNGHCNSEGGSCYGSFCTCSDGMSCDCSCDELIDYNYLTTIRPVGLLLMAIAMVGSMLCAIWTQLNKKVDVVKAAQPFFLLLICIGCFVMASSIIPLSIDDSIASQRGCSMACMGFPWVSVI